MITDGMYRPDVVEGQSLQRLAGYAGANQAIAGVDGVGASIGFDDSMLSKHVLFIGSIGTGKTVGMSALVESLREAAGPDDVFIFFDSKGDYIERFFREGDASLAVDRDDVYPGSKTWNLFAELADREPHELVEAVNEICQGLMGDIDSGANKIWTAMAGDLLTALITAYARMGKAFTNRDILAMANKMDVATMRSRIAKHPDLKGVQQYIAKDSSNTTVSVLIFFQQAIRRLFRGRFGGGGDFSVRRFVREKGGRALFLEYDVASGHNVAPVFRTLLELALTEALGRTRAAGRVFVVLDEFSLLPPIPHLDAALNFGRSLGLRIVAGTQNVGQIATVYGPGATESILSGFGTVFSFRLYDQLSRDYVCQRYGRNRKVVRHDGAIKNRGLIEQMVDGHVVEDWDLSRLQTGETIASLPGSPPCRFTFAPPTPQEIS